MRIKDILEKVRKFILNRDKLCITDDITLLDKKYSWYLYLTDDINDEVVSKLKGRTDIMLHFLVKGKVLCDYETLNKNLGNITKLIDSGFDRNNLVIRLDPIIPYPTALLTRYSHVLGMISDYLGNYYKHRLINCRINLLRLNSKTRQFFQYKGHPVDPEWRGVLPPFYYYKALEDNVLAFNRSKFRYYSGEDYIGDISNYDDYNTYIALSIPTKNRKCLVKWKSGVVDPIYDQAKNNVIPVKVDE